MISYKPLFHLLVDRDLELTNVIKKAGLSKGTVTNINNGNSITMNTLEKICLYLGCQASDVIEFIKNE